VDPAILASMARPAPDQLARRGVHQVRSDTFRSLRAFAWRMAR
jgi:hypothetical protein